jgi:hypothetical protein
VLEPVEELLMSMDEAHSGAVSLEYLDEVRGCGESFGPDGDERAMRWHKRQEPRCSYCAVIRKTRRMLNAVKGKEL